MTSVPSYHISASPEPARRFPVSRLRYLVLLEASLPTEQGGTPLLSKNGKSSATVSGAVSHPLHKIDTILPAISFTKVLIAQQWLSIPHGHRRSAAHAKHKNKCLLLLFFRAATQYSSFLQHSNTIIVQTTIVNTPQKNSPLISGFCRACRIFI